MRPQNIGQILNKLHNVRTIGDKEWQSDCPCPGHRTPGDHLHITDAGDKALATCFSAHNYDQIIEALGFDSLTYGDGSQSRIQTVYDYTNADGQLLYQVLRMAPKDFRQRRPDGNGDWLWNLKGVTRVLYRLPEVLDAIRAGHTVYICEGEKDCDNLAKIGLTASTNANGAERWQLELGEPLKGADVCIVPDKDEPGKRHADKVAASIHGKARSIRILELPDIDGHQVKDVSDWLAAGGTKEELQRLTREARPYTIPTASGDARHEADEEPKAEHTSFLETERYLFEQLLGGRFLQYDKESGETQIVSQFANGEFTILPLDSEEVALGAVKLPSGVKEYGDTLSLLKEIQAHINRYLDVTDSFQKFAAYYVLLSWLYDRFNTLPYLRFIGDTGCGKSRALDVCGGLCYKATSASGCVTPAPIYRMVKRWAGTIILDEADLQNSDEYHEVTKILNCGFERNRPVIRCVKDNPDKILFLPTYGPKVFATRRRFKDAALEARCLTEIMQETNREDIPATLGVAFYKEQGELRDKLLLFRLRNYETVNADDRVVMELHGIEPRLRQISDCFASLFAGQPEVLADYQAFIGHHQRELIEQRSNTVVGQVVEKLMARMESDTIDTFDSFDTTFVAVSAGDIAESLNITPQAVGQILKTLGLQTKFIKAQAKRCLVYDRAKLATLKRRYIPQDDEPVAMVSIVSTIGDSMPDIDTWGDSDSQALLGLTADQVIEIWQAEGSPAIPISQCETCQDLAKTLSSNVVNEAHIQAITDWLTTTLESARRAT